jgi:DNA-directed RNA polymerase subunit RPC12/RpoP
MRERIAYCKKCNAEYDNLLDKTGEKCNCGSDLFIAERVTERDFSCIKIWDLNNISKVI